MEATIKITDTITIKVEDAKLEGLVQKLSEVGSFFQDTECGMCKSKQIAPNVRESGGYTFIEMLCRKCGAKLAYGKNKEGGLFARRCEQHKEGKNKGAAKKDKDGNTIYLPNNGWSKFTPTESED